MGDTTKREPILEIDNWFSEAEILEMGMKLLNNHGMQYVVYEKDENVYFFEESSEDSYRLFCATSKKSFYLS